MLSHKTHIVSARKNTTKTAPKTSRDRYQIIRKLLSEPSR